MLSGAEDAGELAVILERLGTELTEAGVVSQDKAVNAGGTGVDL